MTASQKPNMLWRPVTNGEELFLKIHDSTGGSLRLESDIDPDFESLISAADFADFVKLAATMEVFSRCVRDARSYLEVNENASSAEIAKELRTKVALPVRLGLDHEFGELARLVGLSAIRKQRDKGVEKNAIAAVPMVCYMCGVSLSRRKGQTNTYTIEHIWPISYGGQTIEENLLPACADCNSKRGSMLSWAAGPVVSTYLHANETIPKVLRLSLGLARMLHFAASGRRPRTLKDAALSCQPLMVDLEIEPDRHHLYFELLPKARAQ